MSPGPFHSPRVTQLSLNEWMHQWTRLYGSCAIRNIFHFFCIDTRNWGIKYCEFLSRFLPLPSSVTAVGCQGYADCFHRYGHSPHTLPRQSVYMWTRSYFCVIFSDVKPCIIIRCLHEVQEVNAYVGCPVLIVSSPKLERFRLNLILEGFDFLTAMAV
jgi:hypothetical protein